MDIRVRESWHCTNRTCTAEISMTTIRPSDGTSPLCSCGAPIKKDYTPPVFTYLDFLRIDEPVLAEHALREIPED